MSRFKKGNQLWRKRKRHGGRRPTNAEREIKVEAKRLAADSAKKYLEGKLKEILDTYLALATGKAIGKKRRKLDPATTRHAVERFVGPAPRSLILDLQDTVESFFEEIEKLGK